MSLIRRPSLQHVQTKYTGRSVASSKAVTCLSLAIVGWVISIFHLSLVRQMQRSAGLNTNRLIPMNDPIGLMSRSFPIWISPRNLGKRICFSTLQPGAGETFKTRDNSHAILANWLGNTRLDVRALLRSIFEWRRSNALAHLEHTDQLDLADVTACRRRGWVYIQHRAYKRTTLVFERGLKILATAIDENRVHLSLGEAFALWRLGRWEKARETLYPVVRQDIFDLANADEMFREIFADACRVFLEVSRDLLQFLPKRRRYLEATRWELDSISSRLRSLLDDLPKGSAQDRMLADLVIRNIQWLTGTQMRFDDVQSEFITSLNSKYPTAAWGGIGHLLQMSLCDGMQSWRMLHRRLKEAHRKDYVLKNYEALLLALVAIVVSRTGLFFPALARTAIWIAYGFRTERTERQFNKQLVKWESWQEQWKTGGFVLTETS